MIEEDCQGVCHKGQCFAKGDPCTSITCDTPPAPKCVGEKNLQTYAASGTCQNQTCTYQSTTQPCAYGCQSGKCQPPPTDPCTGVRCNTPPASKCIDSNTLRNYYPTGQCQQGTCRYSHSDQTCPHGCTQNTCKLGTGFSAISPFRALDTRSNSLPGKESTRCFVVTGKGNVAPSARAVYINLVSVSSTSPGFLTAYPKGAKLPNVSTLNYTTGQAIANGAIIKVGTGGQICVYTKAPTHIIVDLYGFFDADADFFPTGPYRRLDTRQSTKRKATSTQC